MNREAWLQKAVTLLTPMMAKAGAPLTRPVAISVGFPSHNALGRKNRTIGQCWAQAADKDGKTNHIFISPLLDDAAEVLQVVAHELIHASDNGVSKHKGFFVKAMHNLGLEGKPTATVAGAEFIAATQGILTKLGPYPHSALTPGDTLKKQTTRLLKVICDDPEHDPYICRMSQKTLDMGAPTCPFGHEMFLDS